LLVYLERNQGALVHYTARRRNGETDLADSPALGAMMQTKGMGVAVLAVMYETGLIGAQIFSASVSMAVTCTPLTAPAVRLCQRLAVGVVAARQSS
jgi:hypothetical protein